jgi:AraC family transcriptional activator of pobA
MAKKKVGYIPEYYMTDIRSKGIKLIRLNPGTAVSGDHSIAYPHRDDHYMLVVIEEGTVSGNIDLRKLKQMALFCYWYFRDKSTCWHPQRRWRAGLLTLIRL